MSPSVTNIVTWILRILVAAAFLFAAFAKLSGQSMMVDEFNRIGFGPEFRLLTGAIEAIGALLVLNPGTTAWGCLLLLCVMAGAFLTQLVILHGDVIHVLVFAAVLGALLFLTRHAVFNRLSGGKA